MGMTNRKPAADGISRRAFLRSTAAAGLGVACRAGFRAIYGPAARRREGADGLRVAVIGCGAQGRVLVEAMLRILRSGIAPSAHLVLQPPVHGQLHQEVRQAANVYEDYRELLAAEKTSTRPSSRRPTGSTRSTRSPVSGGVSPSIARRRWPTRSSRPGPWSSRPRDRQAPQIGHQRRSNPATSTPSRSSSGRRACSPGDRRLRPVEPGQRRTCSAGPRNTRSIRPPSTSTATAP